ncbi:MAG: DNA polymerase IV [Methanolinea sp.]
MHHGGEKGPRIIFHVDMDSFYASVEVRHHPDLAGKPVVIGADPHGGSGRGVVLTCSYEARRYGIRSAMPISRAYMLCPDAIFLPPRHSLYQETSARVMGILEGYADRFCQVSIDEAYLDITSCGDFEAAGRVGKMIKEEIRREEGLTCSIGVAPGKTIAKIASDAGKPDGLVVVPPERVEDFLSPLPVESIPGIGPKSARALHAMGIRTVRALREADVQALREILGRSAVTVRDLAAGIDDDEVRPAGHAKSISREQTFPPGSTGPREVLDTLLSLSDELCRELARENTLARTVTVKIRLGDFSTRTRSQTLPRPAREPAKIGKAVVELALPLLQEAAEIRLAGVRFSALSPGDPRQKTLEDFST